jgi:hypothetical protein
VGEKNAPNAINKTRKLERMVDSGGSGRNLKAVKEE